MNFSYHLYNMMVFQKMARKPTKNKEKSSFTQSLYKPHGNYIKNYVYIYAVML